MKGAVVVAMALAAAMIVGVAGDSTNPLCDPTYECQFKVTTADNNQYTYDLSGLCSDSQWVLHDAKRHTYYANICGYAKQNCLPLGWTNNYEMGVTVQMWGAPPAGGCQNRCTSHASGTAQPACCTADCQVLGREEPHWSLMDPSNPQTGGVIAAFKGASPKDSDPFWCQFNPATGAQYEREVHYHFMCDEDVDTVQPVSAQQNSTNDCRYTIVWRTSAACAGGGGLGGGWIFILILLGIVFIYVVGGVIFMYVTTKELTFPNCEFWTYFFELVREGFLFVGHGCKKSGGGAATAGSYDDIGASAGGASASFQGSTASYQPATGGDASPKRDYTDL